MKEQGGVAAIEALNEKKAALIYDAIDSTDFYIGSAYKADRSIMNVTFNIAKPELSDAFLNEANKLGLYALKGHRLVGGIRASIYNAMPIEGCAALVEFMKDFERRNG